MTTAARAGNYLGCPVHGVPVRDDGFCWKGIHTVVDPIEISAEDDTPVAATKPAPPPPIQLQERRARMPRGRRRVEEPTDPGALDRRRFMHGAGGTLEVCLMATDDPGDFLVVVSHDSPEGELLVGGPTARANDDARARELFDAAVQRATDLGWGPQLVDIPAPNEVLVSAPPPSRARKPRAVAQPRLSKNGKRIGRPPKARE